MSMSIFQNGMRAIQKVTTTLLLATLSPYASAALSSDMQSKIRAATFEVVIEKPVKDSLTYERALPLDLLPYGVRNDKFASIGTAFAIDKNRYVTAAHVLRIGQRSRFGAPALRTSDGHVYAIDNVIKYSSAEDFVVFSLRQPPSNNVLKTETKTKVDTKVYAVGNALGEGIVVRDGIYTSDTPEIRDGRWKWVRFSAAASPGNSGGPLLNEQGRVIGVIAMKSPSENLNYALPIARVLEARENLASVDNRNTYNLALFDATETQALKFEVSLPLPLDKLAEAVFERQHAFSAQLLQALLKKESATTFPNGSGSTQLLYAPHIVNFPALITRDGTGRWDARMPEKVANAPLSSDARAFFALEKQFMVMRMQRPSDVPADKFYGDSKVFGDLFLKAAPITRAVGPEKVRVTSMGSASEESAFVDAYHRKWQLRSWNIEYQDNVLISMALPCPEGYVVLLRPVPTSVAYAVVNDLKALADFIYLPYMGTLQQWQGFLAQSKLLPDIFSDIKINIELDRRFDYQSKRFSFSYTPSLQKITKDSTLSLLLGYYKDGAQVVWDVYGLSANDDKNSKTGLSVQRTMKPADEVEDQTKDQWRRITHREHPFEAAPFIDNDRTIIRQVVGATSSTAKTEPNLQYTLSYALEGKQPDAAAKEKLATALKGLQITEQ